MEWLWTHPLGIALTSTVLGGLVLATILGVPTRIARWWRAREATSAPPPSHWGTQDDLWRRTLNRMTEAVTAIEEVWRSGSAWPLRRDADKMAMEVESLAYQIRDRGARGNILAWKGAYDSAPHGEGQGATPQATVMRDAYRTAADRLGSLLRGEGGAVTPDGEVRPVGPAERHDLLGVGRDYARCSCGWTGRDFDEHRATP